MTEEGENCGGSEALRRASINATAGDAASIFERPNGRCDTSVGTQVLPGDDGAAASGDAGQNRMGEGGDGTSPAIERGQRLVLEPSKQQRPEFPALGPCVSIDMECFRYGAPLQDREERSPLVHPSLVNKSQTKFSKGDEVLCLDSRDGQQWLATILKLKGCSPAEKALVHYKGWGKSCDDWVSVSRLSAVPCAEVLARVHAYNEFSRRRGGGGQGSAGQVGAGRAVGPAARADSAAGRAGVQRGASAACGTGGAGAAHPGVPAALSVEAVQEGRRLRSRTRGVEKVADPSSAAPTGGWRAVAWRKVPGKQPSRKALSKMFPTPELAGEAWDKWELGGQSPDVSKERRGKRKRASGREWAPADSSIDRRFLGARVAVDMGRRGADGAAVREEGSVSALLVDKGLYQIRLGTSRRLLYLPLPSKKVAVLDQAAGTRRDGTEDSRQHPGVIEPRLLALLDQAQDVSDRFAARNVFGALALTVERVRTLVVRCAEEKVLLDGSILNGTHLEALEALYHALDTAGQGGYQHDPAAPIADCIGAAVRAANRKPAKGRLMAHAMKSTDKPPPTAIGRAVHFDGVKEKPHWDGGVVHEAFIAVRGKEYHLGLFDDRIEAARCYDMACLRLHGIAIRLNLRDSPMWVPQPKGDKCGISQLIKTLRQISKETGYPLGKALLPQQQVAPQISELSAASASTGQCKQKEVKTPPQQQQRQARRVSPEAQGRARSRRSLTASPAVSPAKVLTARSRDSPAKSEAGSGDSACPSPQKRGRPCSVSLE